MTKNSPRIYTYKITFEEVPYYYYGSKKERYFDEEYWGSPVANKWCWELYTPKKQILEFFEFSDEGYIKAQEVEGRLINPVYNTDKWCLNESCLGVFSLEQKSKAGKKAYELKLGVHSRSRDQMSKDGKRGGNSNRENKTGICGRSLEVMIEHGRITGYKKKELNIGVCGLSKEQRIENSKITNSQRWECCITGYISTAAGVFRHQKGKGIDTSKSNRRRIA
jgi:hypothetical protein